MSDYEPEQIEYALKVLAECDGSAQAAQDRLDDEFAREVISFNVPKSTLHDWKKTDHSQQYELIRARMRVGQEQETIAELRATAYRAAQVTSKAVTAAMARIPNAEAKEAAQIAQAMAKTAETAANVAAKLEAGQEDDPQSTAADFTEALRALGGVVKINGTISASVGGEPADDIDDGGDDDAIG